MPTGADIINYAKTNIGDPYRWGDEGPDSFDCSGLIWDAFRHFGISVPRTTTSMMAPGSPLQPIQRKELIPGDLIFFNWGRPHQHVGLYLGRDQLLEAPRAGSTVQVTTMGPLMWSHTDAYRRVPGLTGAPAPLPSSPSSSGANAALGAFGGSFDDLGKMLPKPGNVTEALDKLGNVLGDAAQSAAQVGQLAQLVTRAFLPSNAIRIAAFMFGTVFILIGIWFLAREVRESSP